MKNNRILSIAVVVLLLSNIALIAYLLTSGKPGRERGRFEKGDPLEMMAKELKMSEQQKKDYKEMREQHFQKVRPLFDSMRAAKTSFYSLIKEEGDLSDSVLDTYTSKIGARQAELDKIMFNHFRNVRKLFTAEQQPKFDSLVRKMMQRGKKDSARRKN